MKREKKSIDVAEITFEDGMKRLEETISTLERGEMGLEESVGRFREGAELFRALQGRLDRAEGEIKKVLADFDGGARLEDMDEA
jgi:exodeoxyribonuclease VII small subunit